MKYVKLNLRFNTLYIKRVECHVTYIYVYNRKNGEREREKVSNLFTFVVNKIDDKLWKVLQRDFSCTELKRALIKLGTWETQVTK